MVKKILLILVFFVLLTQSAYCLDTRLYDLRQKLFTQAQEIKQLVNRDNAAQYLVLVSTMWDTCFVAITQLDAYFYILGIFNSIKKENITHPTIDFLSRWLKQTKDTDELNIQGLDGIKLPIDPMIRINMERLKRCFRELNSQIDKELTEIEKLRKSLDKGLEPAVGPR
jgi:hypothetical protein